MYRSKVDDEHGKQARVGTPVAGESQDRPRGLLERFRFSRYEGCHIL
ncbi:MAG TPA: hypothetical protein VGP38_11190 [Rubrobacter sp.]|nr:hypothetical protein [Rubrobacter sp.]HEV8045737.1 hypothetical protein [Rubrobacter sp.]